MQAPSVKIGLLLVLVFSIAFFSLQRGFAQPVLSNITQQTANETLTKAEAYVQTINESGFLIFYPNLKQAYASLTMAQKLLNKSPTQSIEYSLKAEAQAKEAYEELNKYRVGSSLVMLVLTVAFGILLAYIIRKHNPSIRSEKGKKAAKKSGKERTK